LKCGRAKPAQNPFGEAIQNKINGRDPLPFTWSCTAKCDKGKGQYRATDDILQCKHEGISSEYIQNNKKFLPISWLSSISNFCVGVYVVLIFSNCELRMGWNIIPTAKF